MLALRIIAISFLVDLHSILIVACELRYTYQPLNGVKCVTNIKEVVDGIARPQCVWRCLRMKACLHINHNSGTEQCELVFSLCELLQPAAGVSVNAFGPPRLGCIQWSTNQGPGYERLEDQNGDMYIARVVSAGFVVIGLFDIAWGEFWGNRVGVKVGPVRESDQDIEFLAKDAACPLPWMSYTAGDPLPFGTVTGGQLADGTVTYVVKVNHQGYISFGFYDPNAAVAYYERFGVQTTTSMDILVLL